MNKVAFIFTHAPHGTSAGREGLDALLAMSAFSEDLALFFVSDGIYQLLADQQPAEILSRDYASTFGVLALYDITACYLCQDAIKERGLETYNQWLIDVTVLDRASIAKKLTEYDVVLTF